MAPYRGRSQRSSADRSGVPAPLHGPRITEPVRQRCRGGRRRIGTLRRGVGRLIDGYADGMIDRVELEPRVADLRARIAQLEAHRDALAAASEARRDLTLLIGRLEDFSVRVRENLDLLDWSARRDVIRLMVRRIEIDDSQVEIVFRIPPPPSGGTGGDRKLKAAQDCTGERRTVLRVDQPQPASVERS